VPGAPVDGEDRSPTIATPSTLGDVLADARGAGFLGPGPLEPQLQHAEGFATVSRRLAAQAGLSQPLLIDLGSGGGLPGLAVASLWPDAHLVLLEANRRRARFLRVAVERLGLQDRVRVLHQRAEEAGRLVEWRGAFDGLLARSFGAPAVVAECGAPLLRVGAWMVVSEPPPEVGSAEGAADPRRRWPGDQLAQFGLEPVAAVREGFEYQVLRQARPCPERFPRRDGVPAKRPLF
jgi:16S rRNA (guanine527-N7)-methyltransferase